MIKNKITIEFNEKLSTYHLGFGSFLVKGIEIKEKAQISKNSQIIEYLIDVISTLTIQYEGALIQLFNPELVISQKQIINAFYHTQKAFLSSSNISKQKNIEFLVFLAANRKISEAIKHFGVKIKPDNENSEIKIAFLIAHSEDKIDSIFEDLTRNIGGIGDDSIILHQDLQKLKSIIDFFNISDKQILITLHSYNINVDPEDLFKKVELNLEINACLDIINEKMALLSLEKTSIT